MGNPVKGFNTEEEARQFLINHVIKIFRVQAGYIPKVTDADLPDVYINKNYQMLSPKHGTDICTRLVHGGERKQFVKVETGPHSYAILEVYKW